MTDASWPVVTLIVGVLVIGTLFIFLFVTLMLREAEEASLRARAIPRLTGSDGNRREKRGEGPPRRLEQRVENKSVARGGGIIISGFDTSGSRLFVSVGGAAIKQRRSGVCFGRDPNVSEFTVPDDGGSLSRRHFRIRVADRGGFEIEDLGSVAGTKVVGERMPPFEPQPLKLPCQIEIGSTRLDLRGGGAGEVMNDVRSALIGRHSSCDLTVQNDSVSRFHAELIRSPSGRLFLVDRNSTRGTWVYRKGWERLDRAEYVQEDQRVRFGEYETAIADIMRKL